jgi:SAM-dependent methyltransferase
MMVDRAAHRAQSLDTWRKMAPGWEERDEWMAKIAGRVNEWIVDHVAPQPGQVILDLAAGPGELGFRVAPLVGDEGRVISTDFAPEMVDVARRLGEARRLKNVEYRPLDAEEMSLDDDSVDGVVCRWGYMLMADPAKALSETRRVLRDGGALSFAVFGAPDRNPWASVPGMVLVERGHMPPPQPGTPGIFGIPSREVVRRLVTAAGFDEPLLEDIAFEFRYADFDDLWGMLVRLAGAFAQVIRALSAEEQQEIRAVIMERMAPYRREDGSYTAPALTIGALAR